MTSKNENIEILIEKIDTIDKMKECFKPDIIINWLKNGELSKWLSKHGYKDEMKQISELSLSDDDFPRKLFNIFKFDGEGSDKVKYLKFVLGLGRMYCYEKGMERDFQKALKYYTQAADYDFADAQYELGNAYLFGEENNADYAEAAKWYKKASQHGHLNAIYMLSKLLLYGRGIEKNYDEAMKLLKIVANSGNVFAQKEYEELKSIEKLYS